MEEKEKMRFSVIGYFADGINTNIPKIGETYDVSGSKQLWVGSAQKTIYSPAGDVEEIRANLRIDPTDNYRLDADLFKSTYSDGVEIKKENLFRQSNYHHSKPCEISGAKIYPLEIPGVFPSGALMVFDN